MIANNFEKGGFVHVNTKIINKPKKWKEVHIKNIFQYSVKWFLILVEEKRLYYLHYRGASNF